MVKFVWIIKGKRGGGGGCGGHPHGSKIGDKMDSKISILNKQQNFAPHILSY
jgi:hypothetical protein